MVQRSPDWGLGRWLETYLFALSSWPSLLTSVGFLNPPKNEDMNMKIIMLLFEFLNELGHNRSTAQFLKANCTQKKFWMSEASWNIHIIFCAWKGQASEPFIFKPRVEENCVQLSATFQAITISILKHLFAPNMSSLCQAPDYSSTQLGITFQGWTQERAMSCPVMRQRPETSSLCIPQGFLENGWHIVGVQLTFADTIQGFGGYMMLSWTLIQVYHKDVTQLK